MEKRLTQERLKEVLDYNPETGVFVWAKSRRGCTKGRIAGCLHKGGYRRISIDGRLYHSSRLAFLYMLGYFPEHEAEHRNRMPVDDRWENIREATRVCNSRNRGLFKNNTSGIMGVVHHKPSDKYHAYIRINGTLLYRGSYRDKIDAVSARWEAEKEFDFPNCNTISSAYLYLKEAGAT